MRAPVVALLLCAGVAHAEPPARRLEEATMERRVFRQTFVGRITYPSQRLTWVLYRAKDRARLEIHCQEGKREPANGIRLDGSELDESYWLEPVTVRYEGTRSAGGFDLRLEGVAPAGKSRCARAPATVTLGCSPAKTKVRAAGAVLVPGTGDDPESTPPPTWRPSSEKSLAVLRCRVDSEEVALFGGLVERPALFAPASEGLAGVEWVYENSDMLVQTGGYRQIAPR
jgi:hypothetical protein